MQPFKPSPLYGAILEVERATGAPVTVTATVASGKAWGATFPVRLCVASGEHRLSVRLDPRKLARRRLDPALVAFDKIGDMLHRMLDRALDERERAYVGACDTQAARRLGD